MRSDRLERYAIVLACALLAACSNRHESSGPFELVLTGVQNRRVTGTAEGAYDYFQTSTSDPYFVGLGFGDRPDREPWEQTEIVLVFRSLPTPGAYRVIDTVLVHVPPPGTVMAMIGASGAAEEWTGVDGIVRVSPGAQSRNGVMGTFELSFRCTQACPCAAGTPCTLRARGRLETK